MIGISKRGRMLNDLGSEQTGSSQTKSLVEFEKEGIQLRKSPLIYENQHQLSCLENISFD